MDLARITHFLKSKKRLITKCLLALALLLLTFKIGILVGYKKAAFSYRWSENYHRNFGGPPPRERFFFSTFGGPGFIGGHGIVGSFVRADGNTLIVKSRENTEVLIRVATGTAIRMRDKTLPLNALPPDTPLVIIGRPAADGTVDARLIRLLPGETSLPPPPPPFPIYFKPTSTYETQ